jgi:copper chaperone CopZ
VLSHARQLGQICTKLGSSAASAVGAGCTRSAGALSLACPTSVTDMDIPSAALSGRGRWTAGGQRPEAPSTASDVSRWMKVRAMPEIRLSVGSMNCRHCVRQVTGWLRDVAGVETITADATTGTVILGGTMTAADVLAVFAGSDYPPQVIDGPAPATAS